MGKFTGSRCSDVLSPGFSHTLFRVCVRVRKAGISAEKFGSGQERQGLKPDIFSIVYGSTKVVP
jgi:hypothetical protein